MAGWPFIKTRPPASPYGPQGGQRNFFAGEASANAPYHPGQYPLPYAPYSLKYLVQRCFEPFAPSAMSSAVVMPVALRGSGLQLTGGITTIPLLEPTAKSGLLA